MKTENMRVWTTRLREPDLKQTTGSLVEVYESENGEYSRYCCLGVGCEVMGLNRSDSDGEAFEVEGEMFATLPPMAFHQWLGLDPEDPHGSADVYPDWPEDLVMWNGWNFRGEVSCAMLNDECRLTFAQIADVLDYFGIARQS